MTGLIRRILNKDLLGRHSTYTSRAENPVPTTVPKRHGTSGRQLLETSTAHIIRGTGRARAYIVGLLGALQSCVHRATRSQPWNSKASIERRFPCLQKGIMYFSQAERKKQCMLRAASFFHANLTFFPRREPDLIPRSMHVFLPTRRHLGGLAA